MNTNTKTAVLGLAVVALLGSVYYFWPVTKGDEGLVACTMEARMCPDGSYVGRTGPNCEFTACPNSVPGSSSLPGGDPASAELSGVMNQSLTLLGFKVTPLEVVEDSRCATDVQCIQAGTVRVRTRIESDVDTVSVQVLTLGETFTAGAGTVQLISVAPAQKSGTKIAPGQYRFTFKIVRSLDSFEVKG